jgi:CheY-like chemotaxis protein
VSGKQRVPRILVVDDDLSVIASYRHVLEGELQTPRFASAADAEIDHELFGNEETLTDPWRVDFVDQGSDAVSAIQKSIQDADPYALVFLDSRMPPGIDGWETAKLIRQFDTKLHIVYVSAYSDYTDNELLDAAGPEGKVSILPKPVWPKDLLATAFRYCSKAA